MAETVDLVDLTATQVRWYGYGVVHQLDEAYTHPSDGRTYTTRCGRTGTSTLAMLTTRAASCIRCGVKS